MKHINWDDFIIVTHKAGDREPQKVKKFRASCPACGKDKGYVFKAEAGRKCAACGVLSRVSKLERGEYSQPLNHNGFKFVFKNGEQGEVTLKSTYELFYARYCNRHRTKFLYEPKAFRLSNGKVFTPDFFIPEENTYVEIKGLMRAADSAKIEQFMKDYPSEKLIVLTKAELMALGFKGSTFKTATNANVMGKRWRIYVLDDKDYDRRCGDDSIGICDEPKRAIYFRLSELTMETIRHELAHAYLSEASFTVLELTHLQQEELFCEIVAKHGLTIVDTAASIHSTFRRLKQKLYNK